MSISVHNMAMHLVNVQISLGVLTHTCFDITACSSAVLLPAHLQAAMLATCFAADNINLSEELQRVQQRRNNILEGRRADFNKPLRMQPGDLEALAQLESRKHQHAEAPYGHHEPNGNHDSYHGRDSYGPTHYEHPHYEGDGYYRTEHEPYGSGRADYGYYPPPSNGNLTTDSRTLIIANYGPAGTAYPQFIGKQRCQAPISQSCMGGTTNAAKAQS